MEDQILRFYARFAADYDLIFADFEQTVRRQGDALDRLIGVVALGPARTVLDCSCGIGTQALGLAAHDYSVTATDLSPDAVERARREAVACGVTITFGVADFRRLEDEVEGQFDIVLSCDNSVAHLLTDDDLRLAANSMHSKVKPGGLLLLSIRDYDALLAERPRATPVQVYDGPDCRSMTDLIERGSAPSSRCGSGNRTGVPTPCISLSLTRRGTIGARLTSQPSCGPSRATTSRAACMAPASPTSPGTCPKIAATTNQS